MKIDKDTQVCISIASHPGNFGTTIHNAGYELLGLNFLYKAFAVKDIGGAIAGARALGIRGVSISMPHKETVIPYLDKLDESAQLVRAVNTIVNEDGILTGYNTDTYGARMALTDFGDISNCSVLLLGAGGAAKAILCALRELKVTDVAICNRTKEKSLLLSSEWKCKAFDWKKRESVSADLIVNATPLGMSYDIKTLPIHLDTMNRCWGVMDVIVDPPETRLIKAARLMGKTTVAGYKMSLHQAARQFELYTNLPAPLKEFEKRLADTLNIRT